MLPVAIACGRVISDKPGRLSFFFYENVVFGGWMQATIKIDKSGTELWVTTFHVASAAAADRCLISGVKQKSYFKGVRTVF
jgi:hypothetical protein